MNIQEDIAALVKQLEQIEDQELILAIKHLIAYGLNRAEGHISIEQYNRELDEAEAAIDRGEFYTQDKVEKMAKKW